MALTRRQLLMSAGALGAVRIPLADAATARRVSVASASLRLGLLQSAQPFIDLQDLRGSRQRAFAAFRALLERSATDHPPLDWLAAGAFPLSGPGPFTASVLARFALDANSAEIIESREPRS